MTEEFERLLSFARGGPFTWRSNDGATDFNALRSDILAVIQTGAEIRLHDIAVLTNRGQIEGLTAEAVRALDAADTAAWNARTPSTDARSRGHAEERELDRRAMDAALDAEWATDAGGDVPAVGQTYTLREVLEEFGANLSNREIENAMWTALKAAASPPPCPRDFDYDREGPR